MYVLYMYAYELREHRVYITTLYTVVCDFIYSVNVCVVKTCDIAECTRLVSGVG